jgi:hypothetical protein
MKNYDIVAYTFNADIYCPNCIVGAYNGNSDDYDAETMLSLLASGLGIERNDEESFDSSEFPKVVFAGRRSVEGQRLP